MRRFPNYVAHGAAGYECAWAAKVLLDEKNNAR